MGEAGGLTRIREPVDKSVDNFLKRCLTMHGHCVNDSLMTFQPFYFFFYYQIIGYKTWNLDRILNGKERDEPPVPGISQACG
jgi:hypothetical protein